MSTHLKESAPDQASSGPKKREIKDIPESKNEELCNSLASDNTTNPKYSIVVPVYNTAQSLVELSERVKEVFTKEIQESYELIFVNDGSPNEKTWPALEQICQNDRSVRAVRLTRNFGQTPATLCGLSESRGEYIITMDDDLQHRPEDIPLLISEQSHEIVIGSFIQKKHNIFKKVTSRIKQYFDRIVLGKPKGIRMTSFRLLSRCVVDGMLSMRTPHPFIPALMFYVSRDVVNVPVKHEQRKEGKTGYSLRKMIQLFSNLLINNSSLLLRFIGYFGVVISFFSFCLGTYFLFKKVYYEINIAGWTSVIVTLLFLGGIFLFALGVIGEYLIRIVQGIEHKPTYLILKKTSNNE